MTAREVHYLNVRTHDGEILISGTDRVDDPGVVTVRITTDQVDLLIAWLKEARDSLTDVLA